MDDFKMNNKTLAPHYKCQYVEFLSVSLCKALCHGCTGDLSSRKKFDTFNIEMTCFQARPSAKAVKTFLPQVQGIEQN